MKTPREVLLSRYRDVEPELERLWPRVAARPAVAPYQLLWRELIWPCRRVWAGLACGWVLILVLNVMSAEPGPQLAARTSPRAPEEMRALLEQRQMLAQLIGPLSEPAKERKSKPLGPRSERTTRISAA